MSQTALTQGALGGYTVHAIAPDAQQTALEKLFFGDKVEITIGSANVKKLRFVGKDCAGYLFAGDDGKYYRYTEHETRFLLSLGKIQNKEGQNENDLSEGDAKRLLKQAHDQYLSQLVQSTDSASDSISIESAAVSDVVHKQEGGTCWAHACATAIRAVESRIVGRTLEPFEDLVNAIIASGIKSKSLVLAEWCPKKNLSFSILSDHNGIIHALRSGRVVVASFSLPAYHWRLFSIFFKYKPSGILTRADFERDSRRYADFPLELREESGHAIVITGFCKKEGKVVYKIKNSWGKDFACDGFFHVEADAFPGDFHDCLDVFFVVKDLPRNDIRNYLTHLMRRKAGIKVDGQGFIKVRGCSSQFKFAKASRASLAKQKQFSLTEQRAVARINKLVGNADNVEVSRSGRIKILDSAFRFRAVSVVMTK